MLLLLMLTSAYVLFCRLFMEIADNLVTKPFFVKIK